MIKLKYNIYFQQIKDLLEIKYNHEFSLYKENDNIIRHCSNIVCEYDLICIKCNNVYILDISVEETRFFNNKKFRDIYFQYELYENDTNFGKYSENIHLKCHECIIKGIIE